MASDPTSPARAEPRGATISDLLAGTAGVACACGLPSGLVWFAPGARSNLGRLEWVTSLALWAYCVASVGLAFLVATRQATYRRAARPAEWGSLVLLADQQGPFALPAGPFEPGDRVGLGARHNSTALRVRFSGVRIRKLPYGPLMELSDHKVLLQEAAKMVDVDPDDWFARFVRGTTYFQLQRFDEALVDLRELARLPVPQIPTRGCVQRS